MIKTMMKRKPRLFPCARKSPRSTSSKSDNIGKTSVDARDVAVAALDTRDNLWTSHSLDFVLDFSSAHQSTWCMPSRNIKTRYVVRRLARQMSAPPMMTCKARARLRGALHKENPRPRETTTRGHLKQRKSNEFSRNASSWPRCITPCPHP